MKSKIYLKKLPVMTNNTLAQSNHNLTFIQTFIYENFWIELVFTKKTDLTTIIML